MLVLFHITLEIPLLSFTHSARAQNVPFSNDSTRTMCPFSECPPCPFFRLRETLHWYLNWTYVVQLFFHKDFTYNNIFKLEILAAEWMLHLKCFLHRKSPRYLSTANPRCNPTNGGYVVRNPMPRGSLLPHRNGPSEITGWYQIRQSLAWGLWKLQNGMVRLFDKLFYGTPEKQIGWVFGDNLGINFHIFP